jgi:hypothetical protein
VALTLLRGSEQKIPELAGLAGKGVTECLSFCRASFECLAFNVEDVAYPPDGLRPILTRRSKMNHENAGSAAYPSRETVTWLKV